MLQSYHKERSIHSSTGSSSAHSCPFCRCKSLDASINIKIIPRQSACNIRICKQVIQSKIRNSKMDTSGKKVYYRNFDSPRKSGLSPNGNKKILIQYVSPQSTIINSTALRPFAKPQFRLDIKSSFIISSPIKTSARNIYTNQNTPPKAKYLQKKSSRKNSHQKMQYSTPVQGLTLVDSERVRKTVIQQPNQQLVLLMDPTHKSNKGSIEKLSLMGRIDYFQKIPQTQTKNIIKLDSGYKLSGSALNSLTDSSPRVTSYNNSTPSTPMDGQFDIVKWKVGASIKDMIQRGEGKQEAVKREKSGTQGSIQVKKMELTPKSVKLSPGKNSYSHEKFDKTLGKLRSVHKYADKKLIYSQSDNQTANYHSDSERQQSQTLKQRTHFPGPFYRAQQNMKPFSQQELSSNQDKILQMSDNFSTPKSKYKATNAKSKYKAKYEKRNNTGEIRFYPLGDNKRARAVRATGWVKEQEQEKRQVSEKSIKNKDEVKYQNKQNQKQKPQTHISIPFHQPQAQNPPVKTQSQYSACQQTYQPSNLYAAQLAQQLDLNYDYYFYQPIHSANLYQKHISNQQKDQSSLEDSGSVDVTF